MISNNLKTTDTTYLLDKDEHRPLELDKKRINLVIIMGEFRWEIRLLARIPFERQTLSGFE